MDKKKYSSHCYVRTEVLTMVLLKSSGMRHWH